MEKLFVYGTLGPGRPNEHILKNIGGTWKDAFVFGELFEEGWGAEKGFPGIRFENKVAKVRGFVFYSENLKDHWKELDAFEGAAYQRIKTEVILIDTEEVIEVDVYALK